MFLPQTNHEAMLSQMRENFELEKENLLAEERRKWSEKLEQDLNQYKMKMEAEKQVGYTLVSLVILWRTSSLNGCAKYTESR